MSIEPGTSFARLQRKLDELERKYTLEQIKEKAIKAGVSTEGSKRDILVNILVRHAETFPPPRAVPAVPMTDEGFELSPGIRDLFSRKQRPLPLEAF